jgi:hypothetical protein
LRLDAHDRASRTGVQVASSRPSLGGEGGPTPEAVRLILPIFAIEMAGPDYILDIQGLPGSAPPKQSPRAAPGAPGTPDTFAGRPWLAVSWRCCGVYSRIYRNAEGTLYEGRCPRCARPVRVRVGPGGTSARFFEAQ